MLLELLKKGFRNMELLGEKRGQGKKKREKEKKRERKHYSGQCFFWS
jgi:hypothetical protein